MVPNLISLKLLIIGSLFISSGTSHLISNEGKQHIQTLFEFREENGVFQKLARQIKVEPNQIPNGIETSANISSQAKIDSFYDDCSEPFKKCWGVAYYPDGDDISCMEKIDCYFAFSVTENEDNFVTSSLRRLWQGDGIYQSGYGDELLRMYIGYVPLKDGKHWDESIDCERTPNLEDFKVMAYSRESSYKYIATITEIKSFTWGKTWLQENCNNSIQESIQDEKKRLYNIKSYMKYHNLQKLEAFTDWEDYIFDLERRRFQNPVARDPNFYRLKEDAEYVNAGFLDEFYDRCQYPSKATCYGFWAKGCIERRDCYFMASIRETTDMIILQLAWSSKLGREHFIAAFAQPYKNLGETTISHCRELVKNDYKIFIYSNMTEEEAPSSNYRALFDVYMPKNEYIESCNSPDNEELPNPIPLEHFYRDNTIFRTYEGDYGENFERLEGMFKSKDGVLYTNLEHTDYPTTTDKPGDGNDSWDLKANSIFVIPLLALSMLMNF